MAGRRGGSKPIAMQPRGEENLPQDRTQYGSLPRGFKGDRFSSVEYLKNGSDSKVFSREDSPTRPAFRSASLPRGLGRGLIASYLRDGSPSGKDGPKTVRDGGPSGGIRLQRAQGSPQNTRDRTDSSRRASADGTLTATITKKGQPGKVLARKVIASQECLLMGNAKTEPLRRQSQSKTMDRGASTFVRSYSMRESSTAPRRSIQQAGPSSSGDHTPMMNRRGLQRTQSNREPRNKAKLTISFIDKNANVLKPQVIKNNSYFYSQGIVDELGMGNEFCRFT